MGWISCCVRNGREPVRARASADIEEAPRLSAENRREAYVPESWFPPAGSPRRYIILEGGEGRGSGNRKGENTIPGLGPPQQRSWPAGAVPASRLARGGGHIPRERVPKGSERGLGGVQQSRRRLLTALGWNASASRRAASGVLERYRKSSIALRKGARSLVRQLFVQIPYGGVREYWIMVNVGDCKPCNVFPVKLRPHFHGVR